MKIHNKQSAILAEAGIQQVIENYIPVGQQWGWVIKIKSLRINAVRSFIVQE